MKVCIAAHVFSHWVALLMKLMCDLGVYITIFYFIFTDYWIQYSIYHSNIYVLDPSNNCLGNNTEIELYEFDQI